MQVRAQGTEGRRQGREARSSAPSGLMSEVYEREHNHSLSALVPARPSRRGTPSAGSRLSISLFPGPGFGVRLSLLVIIALDAVVLFQHLVLAHAPSPGERPVRIRRMPHGQCVPDPPMQSASKTHFETLLAGISRSPRFNALCPPNVRRLSEQVIAFCHGQ